MMIKYIFENGDKDDDVGDVSSDDIVIFQICFLCMKTKFGIFNWGCRCQMCSQLVSKIILNGQTYIKNRSASLSDNFTTKISKNLLSFYKKKTEQKILMRTEVELRPCPMRSHVPGLSSPADDITTNYPLLSLMCLILSLQIEIQMSRHPLMISQHHTPFSLI